MLLPPSGPKRAFALAVAAAVLLTGCVGQEGPDAAPASTAGMAVQPGVDDPHEFVVEVRADTEDGAPLSGAVVVFFVNLEDADLGFASPFYIYSDEWSPNETLDPAASPHFEVLAVGRTDDHGRVVGLLDPDVAAPSVAVGGLPGYTTEAVVAAFTVDVERVVRVEPSTMAHLGGPLVVPLYRTERPVTIDDAMEPTVNATALPGQSGPAWDPTILDFGPATEAYSQRLDGLDLRLTWNNTATAYGDLHLLAQTSSGTVRGPDAAELPADGAHEARLDADLRGGRAVVVGPATDTLAVGADGLPYRIQGTAHFAGAPIVLPDGPG